MGKSSVSLRHRLRPRLHVESFEDRRLLSAGSLVFQLAPQWLRTDQVLRSFDARTLTLLSGESLPTLSQNVADTLATAGQVLVGEDDPSRGGKSPAQEDENGGDQTHPGHGGTAKLADAFETLRERFETLRERDGDHDENRHDRGSPNDGENLGPNLTDGTSEGLADQNLSGTDLNSKPLHAVENGVESPRPAADASVVDLRVRGRQKEASAARPDAGDLSGAVDSAVRMPASAEAHGPTSEDSTPDRDQPMLPDHGDALPPFGAAGPGGSTGEANPADGTADAAPAIQLPLFGDLHPQVPVAESGIPNRPALGRALPFLGAEVVVAARGTNVAENQQPVQNPTPAQDLAGPAPTPRGETPSTHSHSGESQAALVAAAAAEVASADPAAAPVEQLEVGNVAAYVPAVAGLLEAVTPFDRDAVQAAMRQFLEQVEKLGGDASSWLAQMNLSSWVVGMALGLTAYDVARRRQRQARPGLALTDDDGTPVTWFPGMAGLWNVQDAQS